MGLREQAALDARAILNDLSGFAYPITVIAPSGVKLALTGFSNDIAEAIDPETGMVVSGRVASVALAMVELTTGIPQHIAEGDQKPWVIVFDDILGNTHTFKVMKSTPDRGFGVITLTLEQYVRAADGEVVFGPETVVMGDDIVIMGDTP